MAKRKKSTKLDINQASDSENDEPKQPAAKRANFFLNLEPSLNDKTLQVYKDDEFICIKDKFPKAKQHYLLVPTAPKLTQLNELNRNKLNLLEKMKDISENLIKTKFTVNDVEKYKIGFHSIQSMYPLHMHIITKDFQSDCLKNKKHWNSFNTKYFLNLSQIIEHLKQDDNQNLNELIESKAKLESYLKSDLKCNRCGDLLANMPKLKLHLLKHK